MSGVSILYGTYRFVGNVLFGGQVTLPASCVSDDQIAAAAAIDATKLGHEHVRTYGQSGTATTVTIPLHVAAGAGEIVGFRCGSVVAAIGDSTVTVDLKRNGTTMLTGVVTLDSGNTAYIPEEGTLIGSPTLAADQVLTLVITATAGGGTLPTGLFCQVVTREAAAA